MGINIRPSIDMCIDSDLKAIQFEQCKIGPSGHTGIGDLRYNETSVAFILVKTSHHEAVLYIPPQNEIGINLGVIMLCQQDATEDAIWRPLTRPYINFGFNAPRTALGKRLRELTLP